MELLMLQTSQRNLLEVVGTFCSPTGLARRLHRRQQKRHQHADDGDHRQELNECERSTRQGLTLSSAVSLSPPQGLVQQLPRVRHFDQSLSGTPEN